MDAYCNADTGCVDSIKQLNGSVPLVALDDGPGSNSWRCYSPSCLDAGQTHYIPGSGTSPCKLYCSREAQLAPLLQSCQRMQLFANGDNSTHCFRIPNIINTGKALLVFAGSYYPLILLL
jgi:hypothetical protein